MAFNNYPYTDYHELNLSWVIEKQKATAIEAEEALNTAREAESKVDNFIDNLDLQDAVDTKMDQMYADGDFDDIFDQYQKLHGDVIIVTASFGREHPTENPDVTIYPFTAQCKAHIETYTDRKCYVNAIGRKGFHNDGFLEVLQGLESEVEEPNKVGIIMVAGGGNDVSDSIDEEDITLGMQHFMEYVKVHYPNAIVRFAWLTWLRTYQSFRKFEDINKVIGWYKQYANRYGIGYCENSEYIYHQYNPTWYLSDNYHPSTIGSYGIAHGIMECILNGSCSPAQTEVVSSNFFTREDTDNPIEDCATVTVIKENNMVSVIPGNDPATPTFKMNIRTAFIPQAFGTAYGLATVNSNLLLGAFPVPGVVKFNFYAVLYDSTGNTNATRTVVNGTGMIYSGYLYVVMPRDSTYLESTYDKMAFFLPTITIPTKLA